MIPVRRKIMKGAWKNMALTFHESSPGKVFLVVHPLVLPQQEELLLEVVHSDEVELVTHLCTKQQHGTTSRYSSTAQ